MYITYIQIPESNEKDLSQTVEMKRVKTDSVGQLENNEDKTVDKLDNTTNINVTVTGEITGEIDQSNNNQTF